MKPYRALILFMTLSTACGLRCYTCNHAILCTDTTECPILADRCFSEGSFLFTKGCLHSKLCLDGKSCCQGDLCNSAAPTGPGVLLLLVSSAIVTLFL